MDRLIIFTSILWMALPGAAQVLFDQTCCEHTAQNGCGYLDRSVFFECSDADDFFLENTAVIRTIEIRGLYEGALNDGSHGGVTVRIWSDVDMLPDSVVWEQDFPNAVSTGEGDFAFDVDLSLSPGTYWLQVMVDATDSGGGWKPLYSRPEDNWRGTLAREGVETFGAWTSQTDGPGLLFQLRGDGGDGPGPKRMVSHVTRSGGGFTTQVILANLTGTAQGYELTASNSAGAQVGVAQGMLPAKETLYQTVEALFGADDVSHFVIADDSQIEVSIAYQADREGSGPAHVRESSVQTDRWLLYPGNNQVTWDGIAVVNTGSVATDVTVRQVGAGGQTLANVTAIANLGANAKGLYVMGDAFQTSADAHFEITANQPLALTALRGNLASDFLWENTGGPVVKDDRMVAHVTRPGGGFTSQAIITNLTESEQDYVLTAFDAAGAQVATANGSLLGNASDYRDIASLFGTADVSYLAIADSSDVTVSIAYQAARENSGPAHVQESSLRSRRWRIYPGNNQVTWDGFAVVNTGGLTTQVTVNQVDASGANLASQVAISELSPNIKGLYVISNNFSFQANSHFEIIADQPLAITALRGNLASDFLWENKAIPLE